MTIKFGLLIILALCVAALATYLPTENYKKSHQNGQLHYSSHTPPPSGRPGGKYEPVPPPPGKRPGDHQPGGGKPEEHQPGTSHIGEKYEPGPTPPSSRPGADRPHKTHVEEKYEPVPPPPGRRPGDHQPGGDKPEEHQPGTSHIGEKYEPGPTPPSSRPGADRPHKTHVEEKYDPVPPPPGRRPGGSRSGGSRPGGSRPESGRPGGGRTGGSGRPGDHQSGNTHIGEKYEPVPPSPGSRPGGSRPGGSRPGGGRPGGGRPGGGRPREGQSGKSHAGGKYHLTPPGTEKYHGNSNHGYGEKEPHYKVCPKLDDPHYGKVKISGHYPQKAAYSCDYGYKLIGSPVRKCVYGKWEGKEPKCISKLCPKLDDPHYGKVEISGHYPQKATYSCDYGYKLIGSPVRKCVYGKWEGKEPTCISKSCPKLDDPHYGKVEISGHYPQKAIYSCDYGYKLIGSPVRKCIYGKWEGKEPKCISKSCPKLDDPHYGKVEIIGHYPQKATYSCDYGYKLIGSPVRKCVYGKWEGEEPECKLIKCSKPQGIKYGGYRGGNTRVGGIATYYCEEHYKLVGNEERKCLPDGNWGGKQPECVPDDSYSKPHQYNTGKKAPCPEPHPPKYGYVKTSGEYGKQEAVYSCKYGYVLQGQSVRKCLPYGQWIGKPPKCIRIDCRPLPAIANGMVVTSPDPKLGSYAKYTCSKGYRIDGYPIRRCLISGQWSSSEPSCIPVDCGELSNPVNGQVQISPNNKLGSVAIYKCRFGYVLSGVHKRFCQADARWSSTSPSCRKIDCGRPPAASPNGSKRVFSTRLLGSTLYTCNKGYFLRGSRSIYCRQDGKWSDTAPLCKPVDCGTPDPPDPNGSKKVTNTVLNGKVIYYCNKGFNLVGNPIAVCKTNGQWSSKAPTCKQTPCPRVKPPHHGRIFVSGYYPGDYIRTKCSYGYKLVGKPHLECLYNGYWSHPPARCVKDTSHHDKLYYVPSREKYE